MVVAFQLAWRQLRHEPRKLLAGIAGVVFSVVLMFMQIGFRDALFVCASGIQSHLAGDLFIIRRQSDNVGLVFMSPRFFPRAKQILEILRHHNFHQLSISRLGSLGHVLEKIPGLCRQLLEFFHAELVVKHPLPLFGQSVGFSFHFFLQTRT